MHYSGPDANYVELLANELGDRSRSKEWMKTSPEFAANPIDSHQQARQSLSS
jgi:hypothetical protein